MIMSSAYVIGSYSTQIKRWPDKSIKDLTRMAYAVRERSVKVLGCAVSGGRHRNMEDTSVSGLAAERAYKIAGITPAEVDLAEVHDVTAFAEIL